jgi:signal transduction histidine kinase
MTLDAAAPERQAPWARSWAPDLLGAALVTAFLILVSGRIEPGVDERALDPFGYALLVVAGGALALCRRRPGVVVGVITVVLGSYIVRRYGGGPVFLTGWVALFSLSWRTNRRRALVGAAALCGVLSAVSAVVEGNAPLLHLVFVGWSAAAVFLGDALRNRRNYLLGLEDRARELERTREEESRRRVAEERLRIARDLHDSVAHAMATINVQAGAAAHVVDRRPEVAKEALAAIQRASGDVLDELAGLLGLLRDDDQAPDRAPTPGIDQVEDLVAATRDARVPVSLVVEGATGVVPKPVGTAAYRIVQEALTNVIRHAGAARAQVTIRVGADRSLTVDVTDDGTGADGFPGGNGMGIRGMRERAESTGGTLDAGPRPGGGFAVRARWPGRT